MGNTDPRHFATTGARIIGNADADDDDDGSDGGNVRLESFRGQKHVVAPVVAVTEGILKGRLLPNEEIAQAANAFAGAPLPINHPKENGDFVSANTPDRIETRSVGRFFGPMAVQSALGGEIWVNAPKSNELASEDAEMGVPLALLADELSEDARAQIEVNDASAEMAANFVANADEDASLSDILEVSTAYWFTPEQDPGQFNGESYEEVQRNLRPDHLALLPNKVGECSAEDGCGAPRVPGANSGDGPSAEMFAAEASNGDPEGTELETDNGGCGCGCGGSCNDDDSDDDSPQSGSNSRLARALNLGRKYLGLETMDYEELANESGISVDTLKGMSDDELESLADNIGANSGGDGDDGGSDGGDGGDGTTVSLDAQSKELLEGVNDRVDSLEDRLDAQETDDARKTLEQNTDLSDEQIEALRENNSPEEIEALAAEFEGQSAGAADMAGRIGFGSGAGFGGNEGDDDKDTALDAVQTLSGTETGAEGDD